MLDNAYVINRTPTELMERQVKVLEQSVMAHQAQQARIDETLEYLKLSNLDLARGLEKHAVALREGLRGRGGGSVRITDVEISFVSMYVLIFKWWLAAGVATLTVAAIPAIITGLLMLLGIVHW
ncbi:MAG: hypothetical protein JNL73_05170 [Anaerolineales bacterium]|nr:hypothetical protein [Anaerolineales bacterium]